MNVQQLYDMFSQQLNNSELQFDSPDLQDMMQTIETAFKQVVEPVVTATVATTTSTTKGKKVTGFNKFTQHKTSTDKIPLTEAAGLWKDLPQAEKDDWKSKATEANATNPNITQKKAKRKPNGYNIYVREEVKVKKGTMPDASRSWKQLPQATRDEWNAKAKALAV